MPAPKDLYPTMDFDAADPAATRDLDVRHAPTHGPADSTQDHTHEPVQPDHSEVGHPTTAKVVDINPIVMTQLEGAFETEAPAEDGLNTIVPGYEIQGELGRGGMGVVYKAVQTGLKRTVALKMVIGDRGPSRKGIIRFLAEAEAMASVSHPNVAQVYEYGESKSGPYLALEYLPGGSLADRLADGYRPDPEAAAKLVAEIARGVAAAHEQGIIHRDMKPHNVLFDANNEPKVTDFGLAKLATSQHDVTQTNAVVGTPAYMAPEQARGNAKFAGPEADVWALGVILYECLTGRRPFDSTDPFGILLQVTSSDPDSPRKHVPRLPRDLELIWLRSMAREASDRYPTAKEMADDLDRFLAGEPVTVHTPGMIERTARWARRKPTAAAAWALGTVTVALTVFGGTAAGLWLRAEDALKDVSAARTALAGEKEQTEVALVREQEAKQSESVARAAAEDAAKRERKALAELTVIRDANAMGLTFREYQANDLQKARALLADTSPAAREAGGWEWRYLNRVCNGEVLRLGPATGRAYAVLFGAGGNRLVTAHADGAARIWDGKTGKLVRELRPQTTDGKPSAEVLDVAASPDRQRVVTVAADGVVRVWDADTGAQVTAIRPGESAAIHAVAYNPDGKSFVAAGADGVLRVWDAASFKERLSVPAEVGAINSVRFSPDGKLLAVGGENGGVKVWKDGAKVPEWAVPPLKEAVSAVAITDAARLAVADVSGVIRLWDLASGQANKPFRAHAGKATAVAFSPDGSQLATTGTDRVVRVWDGKNGARQLTLKGHTDSTWGVAFDPTGKRLASAGLDGTVRVWDLSRPPEGWLLPAETTQVNALTVSPDGGMLAVAGREKRVKVFALGDDGPKAVDAPEAKSRTLPATGEPDPLQGQLAVRFAEDGGSMTSVTTQGEVIRWVPEEKGGWRVVDTSVPLGAGVKLTAAAFTPLGDQVAVGRDSGEVAVWNVPERKLAWVLPAHHTRTGAVAFSPDGRLLVTGGWDGEGKVWDVAGRRELAALHGHDGEILTAAFSPNGKLVATASADHTARLWDPATGAVVRVLKGHMHWVRSAAFSPDGTRLATAGKDGVLKIWDVGTGYELLSLPTQIEDVSGVAFSPDGNLLFAGGADGLVRVYDAAAVGSGK